MDFLKKHYEKILLGLVLAGLIGVLIFMVFYIVADKSAMDERANAYINPRITALTNLDTTLQDTVRSRTSAPYSLDFETTNKLFNPVIWQKTADGTLIKVRTGNEVDAHAVVVTNITPLYMILTLDTVTTNESGARYAVGVEKQAANTPAKRRKTQRFVSVGDKANETFSLVEVRGVPENPDALVLKLTDTGETATVSRERPFQRVEAYMGDFRYDLEKKVFRGRRIGDKVTFGGIDYLVAEVNQNELILSDQTNQKKTSLPFVP